jgi:ADP-ribosylglycohydrolase
MQATFPLVVDVRNTIHLLNEWGLDVAELTARCAQLAERLDGDDAKASSEAWRQLERDVLQAERDAQPPEPTALDDILPARPDGRTDAYPPGSVPTGDDLADRVAGAWAGRIAGCILGKPVECLMRERDSRAKLKELLQASGDWPLSQYVSERTMNPYWESARGPSWFTGKANPSLREHMDHAPSDDDLNYTVLSLMMMEEHGLEWGPDDVVQYWLGRLPYGAVCTAEKIAYRNRVLGLGYPEVATYHNPYREWIGAQIRTDAYGYVLPGRPERAGRAAWNDAACSHVMNGIYGAMWVSSAVAAAFVETDPVVVIERGLEQVPEDSRFTRHMRRTIQAVGRSGGDYEKTFDDIDARLGDYHCVHTINNACVVAAALLHGGEDLGTVISIAVMGGLDTDCNGATAGSIAGAMLGRSRIEDRWIAPFNDRLRTAITGCDEVAISGLTQRTLALIERFAER